MAVVDRIARGLLQAMQTQLNDEIYSDVKIVVGESAFWGHRFLLSATSHFFRAMFRSGMNEKEENTVVVEGVSAEVFQLILDFIYKGKNVLNEDNVKLLWYAANQLRIDLLFIECELFQMNRLDKDNCIDIFIDAKTLGSRTILCLSWAKIESKFAYLANSDNILLLDPDDMKRLVGSEQLDVTSEDVVVRTIKRWVAVKSKGGYRSSHLGELLTESRISLASGTCLQDLLQMEEVTVNPEAFEIVKRAVRYFMRLDRRHDFLPLNAVHRKVSKWENCLVTCLYDSAGTRLACRNYEGKWFTLKTFKTIYVPELLNFDNHLFVWSKNTKLPLWFECEKRVISNYSETCKNYSGEGYIAHGDCLYVIRKGDGPDQIHRINMKQELASPGTADWEMVAELRLPVVDMVMTSVGENLVIFGRDKSIDNVVVIQLLNTLTDQTFHYAQDMHGDPTNMVIFKKNEETFILQQDGSLWRLVLCSDSELDIVSEGTLWTVELKLRGATVYKNELIVLGKIRSDSHNLSDNAGDDDCDNRSQNVSVSVPSQNADSFMFGHVCGDISSQNAGVSMLGQIGGGISSQNAGVSMFGQIGGGISSQNAGSSMFGQIGGGISSQNAGFSFGSQTSGGISSENAGVNDSNLSLEWDMTDQTFFSKIRIINCAGNGLVNVVIPKRFLDISDPFLEKY